MVSAFGHRPSLSCGIFVLREFNHDLFRDVSSPMHYRRHQSLRGGILRGERHTRHVVAFSEYSMALGYELARQDPDMPADDLLYEVRSTLNRVAKAAAALYVS
jgi:hypothetical protein